MSKKCKALTIKNVQCKKNAKFGDFCDVHNKSFSNKGKSKEIGTSIKEQKYEISFDAMGMQSIGLCAICCENVHDITDSQLKCAHIFHLNCIKNLRNPVCPCCRKELKSDKLKIEDIRLIEKRYEDDTRETHRISTDDYIDNIRDENRNTGGTGGRTLYDEPSRGTGGRTLYESSDDSSEELLETSDLDIESMLAISLSEYIEYGCVLTGLSPEEIYKIITEE